MFYQIICMTVFVMVYELLRKEILIKSGEQNKVLTSVLNPFVQDNQTILSVYEHSVGHQQVYHLKAGENAQCEGEDVSSSCHEQLNATLR